jgi:gluconolactonase
MRFSEDDGHTSVFRQPSMNSNGNTIDREGLLITCEHGGRRVTRTELDGSITIIADKYNGKKLNSPNDVVVASDGSIWFTDPIYGIGGNYEGIKEQPEQEKHNVYRADPRSGDIKVVVDDFVEPNGITFSPDEAQRAAPLLEPLGLRMFTSAHPSPLVRASQPDAWRAIPSVWARARAA